VIDTKDRVINIALKKLWGQNPRFLFECEKNDAYEPGFRLRMTNSRRKGRRTDNDSKEARLAEEKKQTIEVGIRLKRGTVDFSFTRPTEREIPVTARIKKGSRPSPFSIWNQSRVLRSGWGPPDREVGKKRCLSRLSSRPRTKRQHRSQQNN